MTEAYKKKNGDGLIKLNYDWLPGPCNKRISVYCENKMNTFKQRNDYYIFIFEFYLSEALPTIKESESHSAVSNLLQPHGLYRPWNSPGQNTGVGSLSPFQGIFPTQESNRGLLHWRRILYQLSYQGSPTHFCCCCLIFVYLVMLGPSCGTQDLWPSLQHLGSFTCDMRALGCSMQI